MKRKQKKYESVFEIDVDIIKHKRMANKLEKLAADQTKVFRECIAKASEEGATPHSIQYWNEQADFENKKLAKIRKQISSIFEMQIPRLVRTRAALQTMPFSFLPKEEGVVIQNG
jgi:hypothetical protein